MSMSVFVEQSKCQNPWPAPAVQATTVESTVSKPIVETGLLCLPQLQHPLAASLTMTCESNDKGNPPPARPRSSLVKVNRRIDTCKQPICHTNLLESASCAQSVPRSAAALLEGVLPKCERNGRGFSSNRNRGGTSEPVCASNRERRGCSTFIVNAGNTSWGTVQGAVLRGICRPALALT